MSDGLLMSVQISGTAQCMQVSCHYEQDDPIEFADGSRAPRPLRLVPDPMPCWRFDETNEGWIAVRLTNG